MGHEASLPYQFAAPAPLARHGHGLSFGEIIQLWVEKGSRNGRGFRLPERNPAIFRLNSICWGMNNFL
jgi:hypothetical protein